MNNSDTQHHLSRRRMLQALATSLGLSALSPALVIAADAPRKGTRIGSSLFSAPQYKFITCLCDVIIPATETAGAVAAGVPAFIDRLITDIFADEHQQEFLQGLQLFENKTQHKGQAFIDLPADQQRVHLMTFDQQAFTSNPPDWSDFYKELKSLIVFGYYTSEPGATEELIYSAVPGAYNGCVPLKTIGRSWST